MAEKIQSKGQFEKTPEGLQRRWEIEISAAEEFVKDWWKDAEDCLDRYLGKKSENDKGNAKLNLYHQNIDTEMAVLFGQAPKTDVSREYGDANDDEGRVGAEMLERVLNEDCDDDGESEAEETKHALQDYKIVALGIQRCRYETGPEQVIPGKPAITRPRLDPLTGKQALDEQGQPAVDVLAPEVPERVFRPEERVITEHVYWKDFLWSPCRSWKKARWVAFGLDLSRDELVKQFGEVGRSVPLQARENKRGGRDEDFKEAWSRARVWEIWDKDERQTLWFVKGFSQVLKVVPDPLKLKRFFPCPKPLVANLTTRKFIPRPGLKIAQDLHDEINEIAQRLRRLVKTAKVAWAYNAAFPELGRIFEEAAEGDGVAVDDWNALAEKGGPVGQMQFMPLDEIIKAIQALSTVLQEKIAMLYQVEGLSDIVRGQGLQQQTASEAKLKAGFASTRLQTEQDKVAAFATELQRIRAEIISIHFADTTIVQRSNIERTEDAALAAKAAAFIKSNLWQYRIEVKADSIALRDYAALKQERVETISALAQLLSTGAPLVEMTQGQATGFLLEVGKWLLAATKGSQQMEAVFDRFVDQANQAAQAKAQQPPQPNPALQVAQVKAGAEQFKAKADIAATAMDARAKVAEHQMDMEKLRAELLKNHLQNQAQLAAPPPPPTFGG